MATAWVNTYLKEELIHLAAAYGLDTAGTLDELRARMREYVKEHPEEFARPVYASIPTSAVSVSTNFDTSGT